jgi:hypothetical protein
MLNRTFFGTFSVFFVKKILVECYGEEEVGWEGEGVVVVVVEKKSGGVGGWGGRGVHLPLSRFFSSETPDV